MQSMVFISGAAGGFGRAVSVECAERGYDLFLTDLSEKKLETLSKAIAFAYGVTVRFMKCDMGDFNSRTEFLAALEKMPVCFHMIINVAAYDIEGPFLETDRKSISKIFEINSAAPIDMISSLIKLRDNSRTFRVLNVCSMAGLFAMPVKALYASSKRALIDMSLALSEELKFLDVTVTALCPAGMPTNEKLIKNMSVQGLTGRLSTLQICKIASKAIDKALKGKAIYIPGLFNRFVVAFCRFMPAAAVTKYINNRWKRTHKAFCELLKD